MIHYIFRAMYTYMYNVTLPMIGYCTCTNIVHVHVHTLHMLRMGDYENMGQ